MRDLIDRQELIDKLRRDPIGRLMIANYNLLGFIECIPAAEPEPFELKLSDEDQEKVKEALSHGVRLQDEQPEIIRCKDCKYKQRYGPDGRWYCECDASERIRDAKSDHWFCADAERKQQ